MPLDTLNRRDLAGRPDSTSGGNDVAKIYIYPTQIPAFTYGIDPPNPPTDLPTFGPRLLMVARKDVAAGAIRKVLETVFSAGFARISRPPLDAKLLETPPEYELHPGTREYLEFNKPVMAGDVIDLLEKACSLAGAVLGAMFFLWQWVRQRYRRMRETSASNTYLVKVAAIEERMLAFEMEAAPRRRGTPPAPAGVARPQERGPPTIRRREAPGRRRPLGIHLARQRRPELPEPPDPPRAGQPGGSRDPREAVGGGDLDRGPGRISGGEPTAWVEPGRTRQNPPRRRGLPGGG